MLGHPVSQKGIKVEKAKIEAIEKLPTSKFQTHPKFPKHAAFYRWFINDFYKISKPLCSLLEDDKDLNFTSKCLQASDTLDYALTHTFIITAPDWTQPSQLMCDSKWLWCRINLSSTKGKVLHSIYYSSETLVAAQITYTITEEEFLAVIFASNKFLA